MLGGGRACGYSVPMSAWSILLRIVISLALTLNGMASALAFAPMAEMSAFIDAPSVTSELAGTEAMPCHGGAEQSADGSAASISIAGVDLVSTGEQQPLDCCDSGLCHCACQHAVHAALLTAVLAMPATEHGFSFRLLSLGRAAPVLPHLIRPPIG